MVIYGKPTKISFGMSQRHSVFRNESVLVPEYIPLTTPHRADQMKALEMYFQGVVERSEQMSQNVLLSGPVGSGKSMLAKKLGATLERNASLYGNRVKFFHVNCRIDRSLQAILTKCMHFLGHGYPVQGVRVRGAAPVLLRGARTATRYTSSWPSTRSTRWSPPTPRRSTR